MRLAAVVVLAHQGLACGVVSPPPDADGEVGQAPVETPRVDETCVVVGRPGQNAFDITIGQPDGTGTLLPVAHDGPIEIEFGDQGGMHLVVPFLVAGLPKPGGQAMLLVRLEAAIRLGCCDGEAVGGWFDYKYPIWETAERGVYWSGHLFLVFDQVQPDRYDGQPCCAQVSVGLLGADEETIYASAASQHRFTCVVP